MDNDRLQSIVIVGGGTAGWMAAATFCHFFARNPNARITLVESPEIGTVGVGEATVPQILDFIRRLQIDEVEFIRATHATYKLAIQFDGWAGEGNSFFHPFADHGASIANISFQHHWVKMHKLGKAGDIDQYCLASHIARRSAFALPKRSPTGSYSFNYAFHFDAILVGKFLKAWSMSRGVQHVIGTICSAQQDAESGDIASVSTSEGAIIEGDLFIDCSGFKSILLSEKLGVKFSDWSRWLPCDRAIAIPCESREQPAPYTRSLARTAGWQWRIPLQHRVGNGAVYCSDYITDEEALAQLERQLEGPALASPRHLRFKAGMRNELWSHNVVSLGLASGFLEPLESTSIYLVQKTLSSLLSSFPSRATVAAIRSAFNAEQSVHWEHLRDFIILHYALNGRHGQPFWDACRDMSLPSSLAAKIETFKSTGRLDGNSGDFFRASSWLALFAGLGVVPEYYHPAVDDFGEEELADELKSMSTAMAEAAGNAPSHIDFIAKNCSING